MRLESIFSEVLGWYVAFWSEGLYSFLKQELRLSLTRMGESRSTLTLWSDVAYPERNPFYAASAPYAPWPNAGVSMTCSEYAYLPSLAVPWHRRVLVGGPRTTSSFTALHLDVDFIPLPTDVPGPSDWIRLTDLSTPVPYDLPATASVRVRRLFTAS